MTKEILKPKFEAGRIVATPGAINALKTANTPVLALLFRHVMGDWGEVCKADRDENEFSVKEGYRILSAYTLPTSVKLWVITEADRSVTTFLLPSEY